MGTVVLTILLGVSGWAWYSSLNIPRRTESDRLEERRRMRLDRRGGRE